jgi:hypothetical protein
MVRPVSFFYTVVSVTFNNPESANAFASSAREHIKRKQTGVKDVKVCAKNPSVVELFYSWPVGVAVSRTDRENFAKASWETQFERLIPVGSVLTLRIDED